ncbi:MAG: hypothetical protein M0R06_08115 [Sphaerochaeta sp.]|jgi:hypothetical protein|nr:hypothetical protein [Sphaerochaeta sp.]
MNELRLSVNKVYDTGEWEVAWIENGHRDEAKTYYCDDPEEAVSVAIHTWRRYKDDFDLVKFTGRLAPKIREELGFPNIGAATSGTSTKVIIFAGVVLGLTVIYAAKKLARA